MPCRNHPYVEEPLWRCSRCGDVFCQDCVIEIGGRVYCNPCKVETLRDLQSGVFIQGLEMASIGRRLLAWWLDSLIIGLVVFLPIFIVFFAMGISFGIFAGEEPGDAFGFAMIGLQLGLTFGLMGIWVLYEGWMLSRDGQTLGKKIMKIRVVTPEGAQITRSQAYTRAAIRQAISLFCFLIDYVTVFGQDKACIHDQAAKTRVVNWDV